MCAISGIEGLKPTFDIIKFTKNIGIANKESSFVVGHLLIKRLKKIKQTLYLLTQNISLFGH